MESYSITVLLFFNLIFNAFSEESKEFMEEFIPSERKSVKKISIPDNVDNRLNAVPVLYVEGTHKEVGYMIGRTYRSFIQEFVKAYKPLTKNLDIYNTNEGKEIYNESYEATKTFFPQYVLELKGVAKGADVPFYKLFLIHLDDILSTDTERSNPDESTGSFTLMVNRSNNNQFIGHNEDALKEMINRFYVINAHIIPGSDEIGGKFATREERWEAMTYAGSLSGYTSGHNNHGLVFTIDTIFKKKLLRNKIPRGFLMRALLASNANIEEIEQVLTNEDVGTANAFYVNVGFLQDNTADQIYLPFYSITVIPSETEKKSIIVKELIAPSSLPSSTLFRVNRLPASQNCEEENDSGWNRSAAKNIRYAKLTENKQVESLDDILNILGDTVKEKEWQIYTDGKDDDVQTINTGVFDFVDKNWILWTKNPKTNSFVAKLPLVFPDLTRIPEETASP